MTCHVCIAGTAGSVMFSDSQTSTSSAQSHGTGKQFLGPDFVVGGAGSIDGIFAVFEELERRKLTASTVVDEIPQILDQIFAPGAAKSVEFVISLAGGAFQVLPDFFRSARPRGTFCTAGSGAEFVWAAITQSEAHGIDLPTNSLADLFCVGDYLIDIAHESLTVDDLYMVGIVHAGKAYALSAPGVTTKFVPEPVQARWPELIVRSQDILARVRTIRSEIVEAQRRFSAVWAGNIDNSTLYALQSANATIIRMRQELEVKLVDYFLWFDSIRI